MSFNRRNFLQAMGLTAAAGAAPRLAQARPAPPKRLLLISSEGGATGAGWSMNPWGRPLHRAWQAPLAGLPAARFSRALQPLHPHRARLSVLDGLSLSTAALDLAAEPARTRHLHAWTGAWVQLTERGVSPTGPSLDQLVAAELARPGRLPSLALGVGGGRPIAHDERASALPQEEDPEALRAALLGLGEPGPGLSALEAALHEYAALGEALPPADQARLNAGLSLSQRLEARRAAPGWTGAHTYDARLDALAELVAAAFTCDLTRVVTLSLGTEPEAPRDPVEQNRRHAARVARLVTRLEATPEGEGSLMDHVMIVWGATPSHTDLGYPVVVLGGQWFFTPGRYLRWPSGLREAPEGGAPAGIPHQHLLVSVARAMGLDVEAVGTDAAWTRGGELLDLTGEIFEMY
ncbi:MAG: DUF1552 domain-containing protein [Alphaproteobacteria bacterium]|nr:DUF1552 domain-containing protein [Alphaproteobacteria bacterium]MCB9793022.1 DUF1552 domain-containing protein [Alphaproteobacteria bacterium]